jgi:hypothetical protein
MTVIREKSASALPGGFMLVLLLAVLLGGPFLLVGAIRSESPACSPFARHQLAGAGSPRCASPGVFVRQSERSSGGHACFGKLLPAARKSRVLVGEPVLWFRLAACRCARSH